MKTVGIYIQDTYTSEYNRVDLFDDEKISVTSSIQNINDISKTYTDFSQTFTVPASKQNNKIFRHWYDNSNDIPFSTLVKSNAYIEIDTITFRKGKIQLESVNIVDGKAQDYSITFIGILGNLKDTFAGKYLKDLTDKTYDFTYDPNDIILKVVNNAPSQNIMFPLISSNRRWNYQSTIDPTNNINDPVYPIRYNELFPAIRLRAVLNMIETEFGINFDGTAEEPSTFLSDAKFTNAYLYLKNSETFENQPTQVPFTFQNQTNSGYVAPSEGLKWNVDFTNSTINNPGNNSAYYTKQININLYANIPGVNYTILLFSFEENSVVSRIDTTSVIGLQSFNLFDLPFGYYYGHNFQIIIVAESTITFSSSSKIILSTNINGNISVKNLNKTSSQVINVDILQIKNYFPEIKIEDFFSGLLKMFNLTCYSNDGINYTVDQLENYYGAGSDIDITKYVLQDKKALNRVKTYKKINFEYEKSESLVNVYFESNTGVPYGTLRYVNSPPTEGEEYSIKLPFEDLNFTNLQDKLQVGFCLKTDNKAYIPKPIILYDYNSAGTTSLSVSFYTSVSLIGSGTLSNTYKAFGQETLINGETYSLNFSPQQSTLTNEIVNNSLYQNYYSEYFNNIYNYKARLIKLSAILPTSVLTTLKLNDSIIIRDSKYLINTYTTDLTTGLVQFELLTDERVRGLPPDPSLKLNLDAGNSLSYPGTGTTWTDLSGSNNNGTLLNGLTFDSGNGGSIVFDGTDDYINCGNSTTLQNQTFTYCLWIFPQIPTGVSTLIGFGALAGGPQFRIESSRKLALLRQNVTPFTVSTGTINYNQWNYVCVSYLNPNASYYINGVNAGTASSSQTFTFSDFWIGNRALTTSSEIYKGKISQVQVYNRALTPTEILAIFNATKETYGL